MFTLSRRLLQQRRFFMTHHVRIGQQQVPVSGENSDKVVEFGPFKEWVARLDQAQRDRQDEFDVSKIAIQNTDVFGSGKLGFVKLKADVTFRETGKNVPGIVFMVRNEPCTKQIACDGRRTRINGKILWRKARWFGGHDDYPQVGRM